MTSLILSLAIYPGIVVAAAIAAGYEDFRYRSIPQWLVVVAAVAGIAGQTAQSGWSGFLTSIEAGGLALVVLAAFYAPGWMGGGDIKLFAAISCAIGLNNLWFFVRITGFLGALLAVIYLAGAALRRDGLHRGLPYGIAVGTGGVITLLLLH